MIREYGLSGNGLQELDTFQERFEGLLDHIADVVVTSRQNIRLALLGLFAQGHILLDDLPGVGKTLLAKTIATSVEGEFSRIQFTPDLLPSPGVPRRRPGDGGGTEACTAGLHGPGGGFDSRRPSNSGRGFPV